MCFVDVCFYLKHHESSSNEIRNQECYISNKDTLTTLKEIQ